MVFHVAPSARMPSAVIRSTVWAGTSCGGMIGAGGGGSGAGACWDCATRIEPASNGTARIATAISLMELNIRCPPVVCCPRFAWRRRFAYRRRLACRRRFARFGRRLFLPVVEQLDDTGKVLLGVALLHIETVERGGAGA